MQFILQEPQPLPDIDYTLRVGNVYPSKNTRHTKYWIVVAVNDSGVHLFGLNKDGHITTSATYGKHVFDGSSPVFTRQDSLLGRCDGIAHIDLKIKWL